MLLTTFLTYRSTLHSFTGSLSFNSILARIGLVWPTSLLVLLASIWISLEHGTTSLDPPKFRTGFQRSGDTRGTMDIIYGCLTTLVVCTSFVIRPSVSLHAHHHSTSTKGFAASQWWPMQYARVSTFVVALLMPETAFVRALSDYTRAQLDVAFMHAHGYNHWSLTLALFAQMGGFRTKEEHIFSSGQELYTAAREQLDQLDLEMITNKLAGRGETGVLPNVFSMWLTFRFLLAILARVTEGLPIAPLEYVTCAHLLCTLITCHYSSGEPYNVQEPIIIGDSSQVTAGEETRSVRARRKSVSERVGHERYLEHEGSFIGLQEERPPSAASLIDIAHHHAQLDPQDGRRGTY